MAEENIFSDLLDDELDQSEDNGRDNLNPSNGNRYEHWRIMSTTDKHPYASTSSLPSICSTPAATVFRLLPTPDASA